VSWNVWQRYVIDCNVVCGRRQTSSIKQRRCR